MLPEVLRPAGFNIPVAELTMDGLGIARFDQASQEWQVAFIREEHRFTIGIRKLDLQGRIVQQFSTVVVHESIDSLSFTFDNGSTAHFTTFPEGFLKATPNFPVGERRTRDNSYDYRWVIDFLTEVPHGQFVRLLRRSQRPRNLPVTLIRIPNALFYTKRIGDDMTLLTRQGQPPQAGQVFGRTNEQIGAGVYATSTASGRIFLRDTAGNNVDNFPLTYEGGHIYQISLLNMDVTTPGKLPSQPRQLISDYVRGDLHRLYDLMEVAGPKHELFAVPRSSPRAIDGDCHIGGANHNGGLLPDLSELLLP